MDISVQRTFLRLLPQFKNLTIQQFLSTPSSDLYDYIDQRFKLSKITNYRSLMTEFYMKPSPNYNRELIDSYVQEISNLISIHLMIFTADQGGATPKKFTEVFLEGLYPLPFRQAVSDAGPENFDSVCTSIYDQYDIFDIVALHSVTITSSTSEGKVADAAINNNTSDILKCPNCNLPRHKKVRDCIPLCKLCPGLSPHKYFKTDFCRQYKLLRPIIEKIIPGSNVGHQKPIMLMLQFLLQHRFHLKYLK